MKKFIWFGWLFFVFLFGEPEPPIHFYAEYEPASGVLIRWPLGIPIDLVREMAEDDTVYVLVENTNQQNAAQNLFSNNNVSDAHTQFVIAETFSHWTRDWGPHFIFDGNDEPAIIDPLFNGYPWVNGDRDNFRDWSIDDQVNQFLAQYLECDIYQLPAYFTGGNVMTDGLNIAFSTEQMFDENSQLWSLPGFLNTIESYLGIENYHLLPNTENYGIQHIDCSAKLLDEETILIKELPDWHPDYDRIENFAAALEDITGSYGRRYQIVRIFCDSYSGNDCAAYTNSLILNDKVYVPLFGIAADDDAIATYEQAMPGYEIHGYLEDPNSPWYNYDALHCRTKAIMDLDMLRLAHRPLDPDISTFEEIEIKVFIKDHSNSGLITSELKTFWKISNQTEWNEIILQETAHPDSFMAHIPEQSNETDIQYYISAQDNSGRQETLPRTAPASFYEFSITNITSDNLLVNNKYSLQNHPNPFNPSTTISFSLTTEITDNTEIIIYNLKGQKIHTLECIDCVDTSSSQMRHSITWNGRDENSKSVSSGVYFYQLQIDGKPVASRKMLLLK